MDDWNAFVSMQWGWFLKYNECLKNYETCNSRLQNRGNRNEEVSNQIK